MGRLRSTFILALGLLVAAASAEADPLEYFGKPVRGVPISGAVKAGKFVFVSGTPAFDANGKLAVGDFPAQMRQAMDNVTAMLEASGIDWNRAVKTTVFLTRRSDFA